MQEDCSSNKLDIWCCYPYKLTLQNWDIMSWFFSFHVLIDIVSAALIQDIKYRNWTDIEYNRYILNSSNQINLEILWTDSSHILDLFFYYSETRGFSPVKITFVKICFLVRGRHWKNNDGKSWRSYMIEKRVKSQIELKRNWVC